MRRKGDPAPEGARAAIRAFHSAQARMKRVSAAPSPQSDADLIREAERQGKVTRCPNGWAEGALTWPQWGGRSGGTNGDGGNGTW